MILEFLNSNYLLWRNYEILVFILPIIAGLRGDFLWVLSSHSGTKMSGLPSLDGFWELIGWVCVDTALQDKKNKPTAQDPFWGWIIIWLTVWAAGTSPFIDKNSHAYYGTHIAMETREGWMSGVGIMNDVLSVLRNRRATQSSCLWSHHHNIMATWRCWCVPGCLSHHLMSAHLVAHPCPPF